MSNIAPGLAAALGEIARIDGICPKQGGWGAGGGKISRSPKNRINPLHARRFFRISPERALRRPYSQITRYCMDDLTTLGPAMRALTPLQRKFVLAMAADPFGNPSRWARTAGYSAKSGADRVKGHINVHHEGVAAAVLEVARGMLGAQGPILAAAGMLRAAANPKHKKHMQAVEMLANRVGLHEVQEVHVRKTDQTGEAMVERLRTLAVKHGMDPEALIGGNVLPLKQIEVIKNAESSEAGPDKANSDS